MSWAALRKLRIGKKALRNAVRWGIAAASFVAIFFLRVPFPAIIAGAAAIGFVGGLRWEQLFNIAAGHGGKHRSLGPAVIDDHHAAPEHTRAGWAWSIRVAAICLVLWWAPVLAVSVALGAKSTLAQEGVFFSKAALVTFGGAYAVLPYVAQQAVEQHTWLSAPQMLDGLGLAETTPGPLIMVLQFVGFLGGWNHPGSLSPLLAATAGAALTTWVTFVPCFLWIFLGAPHIERLRDQTKITCALSAVTAAVVGVVMNLAVWFGWHVILPETGRIDWFVTIVAIAAFVALQRFKIDLIAVILASGLLGLVYSWIA